MLGKIGSSIGDFASDLKSNVSGQLNEISSNIKSIGGFGQKQSVEDDTTDKIFPIELGKGDRPVVLFTCFAKIDGKPELLHTYFPIPAGLQFSDSAEYTSVDLGTIGGAIGSSLQTGFNKGEGVSEIAARVGSKLTSVKKEEVAGLAASLTPYKDQINLASRTVRNPNTNTIFSGHGIRKFSFTFKMIPKSEKEATLIQEITERFRHNTYAELVSEKTGFILAYPPVWTIRFMAPGNNGLDEITYLPRIFSCYLEGVNAQFNGGTTAAFHSGGAPIETDITLEFTETRALTRKDLRTMQNEQFKHRGIDPETGRPVLSAGDAEVDAPQLEEKPQ
jgi:hypothetical protein